MDDEILFKKEGLLGFLTLNRPDTRNPLGHTGMENDLNLSCPKLTLTKTLGAS